MSTASDISRTIAQPLKKALSVPVIVVSQHDPVKADQNMAQGKFDILALGRQLCIDPEYPNKLVQGRKKRSNAANAVTLV
ncbi:MAG: hypothetical protein GY850_20865 [bacterium]|nr:hypothetical protein [bacterium]